MDDLITEFVTETLENLSVLDQELVRFEQAPTDKEILSNIFRMMHTIKGTCGFLGLPRLEKIAHAGEDVLGRFRDGDLDPNPNSVTAILKCIDQIRAIVEHLSSHGVEGDGSDAEMIGILKAIFEGETPAVDEAPAPPAPAVEAAPASNGPALSPEGFPIAAEFLAEIEEATKAKAKAKGKSKAAAKTEAAPEVVADAPALSPEGFPVAAEFMAEFEEASKAKEAKDAAKAAKAAAAAAPAPVAIKPVAAPAEPVPPPPAAEPAAAKAADGPQGKAASQTIRVTVDVLENLMTLVSEMVLTRNQLLQLTRSSDDSVFKEPIERLSRTTSELQEGVMKTRMQPIGNAWGKLPRIVRDLANELGKKINLVMHGEETELDRQVLELIQDPLTHMVRNSADHGLERPEDRRAAGKDDVGIIRLSAFHEGGHIIIEIMDDGRGINTERIRAKIVERGMATADEVAAMDNNAVNAYIMRAGFSTAEKVTKVSGRGVGMDVVRSNIEKIGGTVEFRSVFGQGSTFTIKIPLTLAIISSLIVESGKERFALPQIAVNEVVRISERSEHRIESLKGAPILRLRDRLLPLVNLSELLSLQGGADPWHAARNTYEGYVVVCRNGSQTMGVIVDTIADVEEIVVKPMSKILGSTKYFSGNTILGDGRVVLILDMNGLASSLTQEAVQAQAADKQVAEAAPAAANVLLFRTMQEGLKAVPLSRVQRIESFDMATTEVVQGDVVVQYRDRLLPLLSLDGMGGIRREGQQQVLVFGEGPAAVGLAIDAIVDIAQDELSVQKPSRSPGLSGSGIISGKAVDIIDPAYFLAQVADLAIDAGVGAAA